MSKPQVICISGTRKAGKDTLLKILTAIDGRISRFSFADRLKQDIYPLLMDQFSIDPFDCNDSEKELIRPIMIAYGCAWRNVDENHWVKIVVNSANMQCSVQENTIIGISDIRFMNELKYFRKEYGSNMFHIDVSRDGAPPPTEEEERHFREVKSLADYHLNWGNDEMPEIINKSKIVYEWLLSKGLKPQA